MAQPERRERTALPLQTRFAPIANINAEGRTAEVVWTTGASVRRRRHTGWETFVDYEERLAVTNSAINMERMDAGAPVLESHSQWSTRSVMAVVDKAWIEGGEGRATVRFPPAGVDPEADKLWGKVAAGVVRNLSVGYSIDKVRIEKPQKHGEIEVWHVERWTPHEISFVAIGADPRAQVRDAPENASFPIEFDLPSQTRMETTMSDNAADEAVREGGETVVQTATATHAAATSNAVEQARAIEQAEQAATERSMAIYALADKHGLGRAYAEDLVKRRVSLDAARAAVLDKLAERDDKGSGHTSVSFPAGGLDATVTRREAVGEAILHRLAPSANAITDRAREYRGLSLVEIAREALHACGVRTRGLVANEIVQLALRNPGPHGASDFPMILANVANKRLRQAYMTAPRTFERWTRGITATDFKPLFPTQIGNFPGLLPVMEGAEFSYGTIAESRETYRLGTFGRIVALTRQAIVNDDLRAFDRALSTAGMKAADLESGLVYNELLSNPLMADGVTLFSAAATRNNQGTAAAITEASITQAIELMAQQRELTVAGVTGDQIASNLPRFILVAPGIRTVEARKIIASTTPAQTSQVNPYANTMEVVEEARLFNTAGPQRWWLAADPNSIDTIEYARLEGQSEPFLDQRVGFEVDGVEFKIRHDFAAKALDHRGLFFNAGV